MKLIYGSAAVLLFTILFTSTPTLASGVSDIFKGLNFSPSVQYGTYSYSSSSRKKRGDDDDHHDNDDDDDGNDIPLDGGLSFLAIAGAGLGLKKVVEHRNKKKDANK